MESTTAEVRRAAIPQTAGDIISRDLATVRPDTSPAEVLNLLVASSHQRVVVTDAYGQLIGLITDAALLAQASPEARPSLLRALAAHLPWTREQPPVVPSEVLHAADMMLTDVFSVSEGTPLGAVLQEMLARQVKRLPVVDAEGRPVGFVERQVLLRALLGA